MKKLKTYRIFFCKNLIDTLNSIKGCKVSEYLISYHNKEIETNKNLPNWLDVTIDGKVSYLLYDYKKKYSIINPHNSSRRTSSKIIRAFSKITDVNKIFNSREIEIFTEKWDSKFSNETRIVKLYGYDILKAFNYTGQLSSSKFQNSCANFHRKKLRNSNHAEPTLEQFHFYIENDCFAVVVMDGNGIKARTVCFRGKAHISKGIFKKGKEYVIVGAIYGEGSGKYKNMISEYTNKEGYYERVACKDLILEGFYTQYKLLCPIDSMFGDYENDLISSKCHEKSGFKFKCLYKARPISNTNQKLRDKNEKAIKEREFIREKKVNSKSIITISKKSKLEKVNVVCD